MEDESEATAGPPHKSTRAKKTRGVFEDIEVDVNFEESKPRQTQPRRSTRSRSKAFTEGSDSDGSAKSVRSTRSTRSTKSTRGAAAKPKKKAKAQSMTEEESEEIATPVQKLKKSTRSIAPPKSAKGRKQVREESVVSESSGLPSTSPPRLLKSARKSYRRVIESESDDWQSAQEDVAPTPRPSTTKKARGRPPKVTKTPKALPKSPPSLPSPTPTSNTSNVSGSYMSEGEFHIPVREDTSRTKKPAPKIPVQPIHEKPSNRNPGLGESRTQPSTSSRLPVGSKEIANDINTIAIDASDDDDDTRRFIAPPKSMASSSNPPRMSGDSTNLTPKPKSPLARKRGSFIGVVLEPSPKMKHQSAEVRGGMAERSEVNMDVDEITMLDRPGRSAETDHDSPIAMDKGKAKATTAPTKPKPLSSAKHKHMGVVRSEASDSAMDVDDGDDYETQDVQPVINLRQASTPHRDPPRKVFEDDSNPFTTVPPQATNSLSAFEVPHSRVPTGETHALAEEEKEMTVEEWTKRESEIQLEMFREQGLRKIYEFKERAAEVRRQIEAL